MQYELGKEWQETKSESMGLIPTQHSRQPDSLQVQVWPQATFHFRLRGLAAPALGYRQATNTVSL